MPDIHRDPGWGQRLSYLSLDLVEIFKGGAAMIVGQKAHILSVAFLIFFFFYSFEVESRYIT